MDVKTGMTFKPTGVFGVLVGRVVVADDVKLELGSDLLIGLAQEGQPRSSVGNTLPERLSKAA